MTQLLTGKDGTLRILDSSAILHGTAPRDDATVDVVTWDGAAAWANVTANVTADDTNYANNFIADNAGAVFIGSTVMFAMLQYLKSGAATYAVGSGALLMFYFDGTDFSKSITLFSDGTISGTDCFGQDGYIGFKIPSDWALGAATAVSANLDNDKYYIKLMTTASSTTDPDADILCPCDGQYFDIAFSAMDFTGPIGRGRPDETLMLDRGNMDVKAHYINQSDEKLFEVLPISFSCKIDDVYNKVDIKAALACGTPGTTRWSGAGVTSKGTTKNDGTNLNPAFANSADKTVNVQILWNNSSGTPQGSAFYEVFFPPAEQKISEGADGITLSGAGGVYGLIEDINGMGNRY